MYQAQPREHDEWIRSQFIMSLVSDYPLYVDGAMLWSSIPIAPDCSKKMRKYNQNVLNRIRKVYKHVSTHRINLDTVSVMHILSQFMQRQLYAEAFDWVVQNAEIPMNDIQFMSFIDL